MLGAVGPVGEHARVEYVPKNRGAQQVQVRSQLMGLTGVRGEVVEAPRATGFDAPGLGLGRVGGEGFQDARGGEGVRLHAPRHALRLRELPDLQHVAHLLNV